MAVSAAGGDSAGVGLTQEQLQAIEERAAAATEGPWVVVPDRYSDDAEREHCQGITAPPGPQEMEAGREYDLPPSGRDIVITDSGYYPPLKADAAFIAHARQDVPALVAEVRRLRKALEDLEWQQREADEARELGFIHDHGQPPDGGRA
jgi:hypothetical protein